MLWLRGQGATLAAPGSYLDPRQATPEGSAGPRRARPTACAEGAPVPIFETPRYYLGDWSGNATDAFGVDWVVTSEDGWSSSPPIRPRQEDKEAGDGSWAGPGNYGARVISLAGIAMAPNRMEMLAAKERIKACITARSKKTLQVEEAHRTRQALVRLTDQIDITDKGATGFTWTLIVTADDPRRYAADTTVASTLLPAATDVGRTYPRTYPWTYGAYTPGATGSVQIDQIGDYDQTPARITIRGPISAPRVGHIQTGRSLGFNLALAVGQTLEIDLGAKTALLDGTASRVGTLTSGSSWFLLVPGENELQFRGVDTGQPTDPDPVMTVTAASAWT